MSNDWQQGISKLLEQTSVAFLATQGEQSPETSMVPYAMWQGDVLMHLSSLARHSQNIGRQRRVGLMICTPESAADSALSLPRLSIQGQVKAVEVEHLEAAQQVYEKAIPDAKPLFSFADFTLYRLHVAQL